LSVYEGLYNTTYTIHIRRIMRKSINFFNETEEAVEKYRRTCSPIPSFTKAVNDLIKMGVEKTKGGRGG
jgi:hypothetical protein